MPPKISPDNPTPGKGNPSSFKRPRNAEDDETRPIKRAERKDDYEAKVEEIKSKPPAVVGDMTDNERFSVSGNPKSKALKEKKKGRQTEFLPDPNMPVPKLVCLDGSNEVLAQVADVKLRDRLAGFLTVLLEGGRHLDAMRRYDFNWNHVQNIRHRYNGFHELWVECRDMGEEYRRVVRTDEAHSRAVDGVKEPIYAPNGTYLGDKTIYSDRLLELLMKADNPEKFRDNHKVSVEGTVIQIGVGFDRGELREEVAKEKPETFDAEYTVE